MRLFNILIFDQTVRGNAEVTSSADFNDTLGKARDLVLEVEVEESSGTTQTITVRYKHSNSGKGFKDNLTVVNGASIASGLPFRDVVKVPGPLGALGQVGVTLGSSDAIARVRVWACGRSQ